MCHLIMSKLRSCNAALKLFDGRWEMNSIKQMIPNGHTYKGMIVKYGNKQARDAAPADPPQKNYVHDEGLKETYEEVA